MSSLTPLPRRPRVLLVSPFPPDPAPEANHALHLAEHLAASNFTVHVVCQRGGIAPAGRGIVVHPVMESWTWSDLPRLIRSMRDCQPDVVFLLYLGWIYGHHPMITFLPTLCRTTLPGVPCVTQFENVDVELLHQPLATRALRKTLAYWAGRTGVHPLFGTLLRDSDLVVALSSPHRRRLVDQYHPVGVKSLILPPPPLIRFCQEDAGTVREQMRDAVGAAPTDFVLVYWGYIYPSKGVDTLLHAFRLACRRNPHLRLLLVGGRLDFPTTTEPMSCRDYFDLIQALPARLGIADRVTLTGHFEADSDTGSRYLHAGDLCVLPLDYGVTLNNSSLGAASTHGLPVIGTHLLTGQDEALEHGRNIYLCPPRDPAALADAIVVLARDAELRQRLRAGSAALARDWHSWDRTTARLTHALRSLIARERTSSAAPEVPPAPRPTSVRRRSGASPDEAGPATPLVSVIVAAHDVEDYVAQCLESLTNQTLTNIEIIVVNDASTDGTARIIEQYACQDARIRVVECDTNVGLGSARNAGMRVARGDYVAFTDGDDWADVHMCDVMYGRANADDADVLVADAKVFYDDAKTIGPLFDREVRQALGRELRTAPFPLVREPRVLLLELVAWTKLYKRAFLQAHGLRFIDGMSSYEDVCFHFSVLLKARRISLVDDAVLFYRRNRPGQITSQASRRNFEVFTVFHTIHENLLASGAPLAVWAMFTRVQFRILDWLLQERVQPHDKAAFMSRAARELRRIPAEAVSSFAREARREDLGRLLCMRRNRLRAYEAVTQRRWPLLVRIQTLLTRPLDDVVVRARERIARAIDRHVRTLRSLVKRSLRSTGVPGQWRQLRESVQQLAAVGPAAPRPREALLETWRIDGTALLLSHPPGKSGLGDAAWWTTNDYYLSQTVAFRPGDVVVDVGAHVGVLSLHLAKRHPFIRVIAIEPDPLNYACLCRNIEVNGLRNVVPVQVAVAGREGRRRLHANPWDSRWATIDPRLAASRRFLRTVEVDAVTLEAVFRQHDIRHCRLLKMTALGVTHEILHAFCSHGRVDLLCGEADLEDSSRAELEALSWRTARQHFWRTCSAGANGLVHSWMHEPIREAEGVVEPSRHEATGPEHSFDGLGAEPGPRPLAQGES